MKIRGISCVRGRKYTEYVRGLKISVPQTEWWMEKIVQNNRHKVISNIEFPSSSSNLMYKKRSCKNFGHTPLKIRNLSNITKNSKSCNDNFSSITIVFTFIQVGSIMYYGLIVYTSALIHDVRIMTMINDNDQDNDRV